MTAASRRSASAQRRDLFSLFFPFFCCRFIVVVEWPKGRFFFFLPHYFHSIFNSFTEFFFLKLIGAPEQWVSLGLSGLVGFFNGF